MKVTLRSKSVLCAGASALVMSAVAPAAIAQDQDEGQRTLSTVTVTATQRAESIQDVPIAVTALDPEALDRQGVVDITSLDSVAPSFNMNSSDSASGGTTLRIRGVGTTGNNAGLESAVGVFLDGVYLSRPGVALGDLMDLEQVEVLRGPQGTLFGRNTSAGALNIKTKKPTLDAYEGFGNITFGNYSLMNLQAGVNIPVVEDKFAVRLSGAIHQRDGYVTGSDGSDSHDRDRFSLRGQALWDLDSMGTIRAILDYSEIDETCCYSVWATETTLAQLLPVAGINEGTVNFGQSALDGLLSNDDDFSDPAEQTGFSIEYNVDTPLGALTYIGSTRSYDTNSFRNNDFTRLDLFTTNASPDAVALLGQNVLDTFGTIDTTTHELRLQNTAFDDRLDWLVGLYYSDEEIDGQQSVTLLSDFQNAYSVTSFGNTTNILNTLAGGADATGQYSLDAFNQQGESFSIFTHNIFSVTDKFDLTVGLRYVEETKDGTYDQLDNNAPACLGNLANAGANALGGTPVATIVGGTIFNCFVFTAPAYDPANPTPLFGALAADTSGLGTALLNLLPQEFDTTFEDEEVVYTIKGSYKLTDDVNIYGGFTHGFKSGGFNLDPAAAAGGSDPTFDSEIVDAWELGLKADLLGGRARTNLAIFHQDLEDFQVLEFTGTRFETFNVGKAQASGFELETEAALSELLLGSFSVTYSDANYPSDCDNTGGANTAAANLCGATLTNAPEWVLVGGLTYENTINDMGFFANANVRHETERRTSTQPTETTSDTPLAADIQDANTKVNLRLGLSSPDDTWTIELWGRNVTDEITKNVTFSIPLRGVAGNRARGQFTQDPATYGVTLRTKF